MADEGIKISSLPSAGTLNGTETLFIERGSTPLKTTPIDIMATSNVVIEGAIEAANLANEAAVAANAAANAGGSPKDSYLTLAALQTAFPTGSTGIYLVTANGHWYSWKGGAWTDGGVYMANPNDDYYNVTLKVPLSAGNYYTPLTARTAVPLENRSIGKVITYLTALKEVDRLTITHIPTLSGNVVVTLNGVDFTIAISTTTETTIALVAAKIALATFTGWTVAYTSGNAYVYFTKSTIGVCSSPKFNGGTTGVTATNLVTTTGSDPKWISEQFIGTSIDGGYWTYDNYTYWKLLPENGGSLNSLRQSEINSAYVAGKLLYMDKKSTYLNPKLNFETNWINSYRTPISAIQFGNFLLDIKLLGTPEDGFTYGVNNINYGTEPGKNYDYYISISKFNSSNVGTVIFEALLNTPTDFEEIQEIQLTKNGVLQSTVTGARVLIYWNALKGVSSSHTYLTPAYGWYFNKEYLFDNVSNIGEFYDRNRISTIEAGYVNKTDLNKYPILEIPVEGTFETMFARTTDFGSKNVVVQSYTNRKSTTANFNKVGVQFTAFKDDIIRVYKTNTYDPLTGKVAYTIDLTTTTKLYESVLTTNINNTDINYFLLPDTFSLKQNESILVAIFSSGTPKVAEHVEVGRTYFNSYELFFSTVNGTAENTIVSHGGVPTYACIPVRLLMDVQFLKPSDIPGISQQVATNLALNPHLTLPAKIYCAVGVELNLWNDGIVLGTDRGLSSPLEYQVHWYCTKGKIFERGFRFTPLLADVGTTSLTAYVYGDGNKLLATKVVSLIVVANTAPSVLNNVVMAGDSLNSAATITTPTRLNFVNLGGTVPSFVGGCGVSPYQHESVGGWAFSSFATQGIQRYRVQVAGITALTKGAIYKQGVNYFSIDEINITGGVGNLAVSKYFKDNQYGDLIIPSGNLVFNSGSGDATINYTGSVLESANPFWNPSTSLVDFNYYCTQKNLTKVDLLSIQCGINDNSLGADDAGKLLLKLYIETLYAKLIAHNSSAKMVVQLPSICGNTKGGAGANYGATWPTQNYAYNVFQIREYILANYDNNPLFPNLYIGIAGLVIDRYYGYDLADSAISARNTTTEKVHVNSVHPGTIGYGEMGDGTYPLFLKLLQ